MLLYFRSTSFKSLGALFFVTLITSYSSSLIAKSEMQIGESQKNPSSEHFQFNYQVTFPELAADVTEAVLFIPIASDSSNQKIDKLDIKGSGKWKIEQETKYGNRYLRAPFSSKQSGKTLSVNYAVTRKLSNSVGNSIATTKTNQTNNKIFLESNRRVPVGHEILNPILKEINQAIKQASTSKSESSTSSTKARTTYDWVVNNVSYKKIGTGWGNGDTFWACNERYGNCTDFHSLFISLARTQGIPAKFMMGFPLPQDREQGLIKGYHCWVELYLPEQGWIAIDASEAAKHPEKIEHYYAQQQTDRIHFSTGRDIQLGKQHKDKSLNYFIYPYVEIDGKTSKQKVETLFSYQQLNQTKPN